jgi:hypothetical protein
MMKMTQSLLKDVTIIPISKFMDLCNMNDSDELDLLDY